MVPTLCDEPLLDGGPRELCIVVCAAFLYRIAREEQPLRAATWQAATAGVVHFTVLLYWLCIAMVRYGHMPAWQAGAALSLLVLYCAAYWAALPALCRLVHQGAGLPQWAAFPVSVVALEWLRSFMLTGFPWGLWGYSQARNAPVLQVAAVAGVYGVSFVIALFGSLVVAYLDARNTPRAPLQALSLVVLVAAVYGGGILGLRRPRVEEAPRRLRVAVLQGNIDQARKSRSVRYRGEIVERYMKMAEAAEAGGADVVVWPESAWPGHLPLRSERISGWSLGIAQLVGVSFLQTAKEPVGHNSAVWVEPDGNIVARYHKQHLVPFGEYVPMRWLLPVEKIVPGIIHYRPGESAAPIGEPPFGVLICYDGVFPEIARNEVLHGAQLLANLTNDAWYGVSSAAFQHRDFYVLRAVETGRWVVRAANTGLSLFVGPDGRVFEQTRTFEKKIIATTVEARQGRTPYVRFGNWLVAVCVGFVVAAGLRRVRTRFAPHKKRKPLA